MAQEDKSRQALQMIPKLQAIANPSHIECSCCVQSSDEKLSRSRESQMTLTS